MSQERAFEVYLDILELAQDPVTLRLGILCSDQFAEPVKEQARQATTLQRLRSLLQEQRRLAVTT